VTIGARRRACTIEAAGLPARRTRGRTRKRAPIRRNRIDVQSGFDKTPEKSISLAVIVSPQNRDANAALLRASKRPSRQSIAAKRASRLSPEVFSGLPTKQHTEQDDEQRLQLADHRRARGATC